MPEPARLHPARLTAREALLFEAGIKLGGLFHQFLGTPVSAGTARTLARTIERAVGLQPYVVRARVTIDVDRGPPTGEGRLAYRYLTPEMLRVALRLADGPLTVDARLAFREELNYPLMDVVAVGRRARATSGPRSGRTGGRSARRSARSAG